MKKLLIILSVFVCLTFIVSAGCVNTNQTPVTQTPTTQVPTTPTPNASVTVPLEPGPVIYGDIVGDWYGYIGSTEYELECEYGGNVMLDIDYGNSVDEKYYGTWSGSGTEYTLSLQHGTYEVTTNINTALLTGNGLSVTLYRD